MKIRRILATAVAAAVTTPVVFLSAAPAFADTKPSAPSQTQEQPPTIEELQKKVTAAQKAYDDALVAYNDAAKALAAVDAADSKLKLAVTDAEKAVATADTAVSAANEKLSKAEADLKALPVDATPEQKAAAEQAVEAAKTGLTTAVADRVAAGEKLTKAKKAIEDARGVASAEAERLRLAKEAALKTLDAAKKELADAEPPHVDCKDVSDQLKVTLAGPSKVAAGGSIDFKLQVTNDSKETLDSVYATTGLFAEKESLLDHADLKWGPPNSEWDDLSPEFGSIELDMMKPGQKIDLLVRLTVDAKAPQTEAMFLVDVGYDNKDGSCGFIQDGAYAEFDVTAKPKDPSSTDTTGGTGSTSGGNTGTTQQGGTSTTSVTSTGQLAKTGSSDVMPQFALAGAAAVALGAGAMFVVRRRKAGADA
ncbi:LPXTG cell wall anchor domain-containing protein [Streptomyces sp. NPDC046316]|uniref:LPXTG cell wall anchor domain-containing protein n=1 Tax=Streptomyces sp. NPDC046316 TaxID=3154494 RepID=UPI0033F77EF5